MSTVKRYDFTNKLEIWGGLECTINRVGNEFRDQLDYTGHYDRKGDIEKFVKLGICAIRYPVLWEFHQPNKNVPINWKWAARQLNLIRQNNITPIVGLVHHGSGPKFTDLLDPNFPVDLASYATQVAKRFPWIEYYTPVNEPLTTARFSGLYGLWYPHHNNDLSFARILLNEVKAIVLSMQVIREINPFAKLVQTEDLAKIHSTPLLQYQADFENERRWLTYDLLCGKINKDNYLWPYFLSIGIKEEELAFFLENSCPPDIMGFNYYVTSERFLDEKKDNYPAFTHGGNRRHLYADTEAVRASPDKMVRPKELLREAWNRYHLPIAMTEVHLHCTREDQMRWFWELWNLCCQLKEEGVGIKAVTAWSLLGAYDWNSLLTKDEKKYETGVFDSSKGNLRPTAMVKLIYNLATKGEYDHPVLQKQGWWRYNQPNKTMFSSVNTAPVLIAGKNGILGNCFIRMCLKRNISFIALSRNEMDISKEEEIERAINRYKPWAVINATGYVRIDEAEVNRNQCFEINEMAPALFAKACNLHGISFMTFSSDMVFDGGKQSAYMEGDIVSPLNVYGESKVAGERKVFDINHAFLIIRSSAFFGPWDTNNFAHNILHSLQQHNTCYAVNDVMISPTNIPDLVNAALDLLIDEESGIWHLSNDGRLTWSDFAQEIAERAGYGKEILKGKSSKDMQWSRKRAR